MRGARARPPAGPSGAIPFTRPAVTGRELDYLRQAVESGRLAGDGPFTQRCQGWLESRLGTAKALLTHSGTAALEMAAILCGLEPGDEVIMPSFTFVSTANAVVLQRAVPVFVDIRPDTFNIDETRIEAAITPRTRAIFVVHYGGVACDMDAIMDLARRHRLMVVEDAAHAILAGYDGRPLGSFGDLAAFSFHETKNLISGEGGALAVNDPQLVERAEIIRQKGTNRNAFFRGQTDKYTWVDVGSSYLPGELIAAFLLAQFDEAERLVAERTAVWQRYHTGFARLEEAGLLRRPVVVPRCRHNAHLYPLLMADLPARSALIAHLQGLGIAASFHYVPLHSSPAGRRFGRTGGSLAVTDDVAGRLLRLPLWSGMADQPEIVIDAIAGYFRMLNR